jgi:hypothetical protein
MLSFTGVKQKTRRIKKPTRAAMMCAAKEG